LRILPTIAAIPNWHDGMDHMPRQQAISLGDLRIASLAAAELAAFGQQLRTGRIVDCTINTAATKQRRIGGVDDGVNAQRRNVGDDDFKSRRAYLKRGKAQAEAAVLAATPLSANSFCNSPAWNISRMISQPPTNSPLT
jgi:hypothetical protein